MAWIGMRSSPQEHWDYVSPFETHGHIREIYTQLHGPADPDEDKIAQIASAFSQGRMYFESAELAPLGVKPVLLYYGASALLAGLALTRDARLTQRLWPSSHGLTPVGWRNVLYDTGGDLLKLAVRATKGTFRHVVETVWHGHIETVLYGRHDRRDTAPYTHRLGEIGFIDDGSIVTFADLVSRSRYTGGLYGSATRRRRSLLRATVWMNPGRGPSGVHVNVDIAERQGECWLIEHAKRASLPLLGSDAKPSGAVFPRGDHDRNGEPDLLPVFHYEDWGEMSVCEAMPNGDKWSELLKLYLMSYIVGMVARYYPAQWLAVIRGTSCSSDTAMFVSAVTAIERNFVREFAGQLAVLGDDPHFFSEHYGHQARMIAPDWRCYIGATGTGKPIIHE
ncbi:MAG: YaaC family protein [Chloroflexi bacterium]|nr:YaaC family protein [Chloroflexota bacterium]